MYLCLCLCLCLCLYLCLPLTTPLPLSLSLPPSPLPPPRYLDTAKVMADKFPKEARGVPRTVRCRYVSSAKPLIDQQLGPAYPGVKFVS